MNRLRQLITIIIGLGLTLLAACDSVGPGSPALLEPALTASSGAAPKNPQADMYYAQRTQEAAALALTHGAAVSTQVAQSTDSLVRLTQVELDIRLTAGAATSNAQATSAVSTATQARALTQDVWTAVAAASTQAHAVAQDTAAARDTAEAGRTAAAAAVIVASMRATQAAHLATATAVQASLDAQTQEVKTWGPIIFVGILAATAIVFAWRLMSIFEARKRVIPQPNGAPLIIQEQRASLEHYLPSFLRWIAWFLETQQVIVDQERNLYPVTVIGPDIARAPKLTDDDRQERVTRRRQFTQTVAALAGDNAKEGALALAGGQEASADDEPCAVPAGGYEIVDSAQFNAWLGEVKTQLLPGPAPDGATGQTALQD